MNVYSRINKIARKQGLSIKELARKVGIGENSIYRWKTLKPSTRSITKVAKELQVSTDYLLGQNQNSENKLSIDIANNNTELLYKGQPIPKKYLNIICYLMEEDITKQNEQK